MYVKSLGVAALAEFELLVLLAVLQCGEHAYSVAVHGDLERRSGRFFAYRGTRLEVEPAPT